MTDNGDDFTGGSQEGSEASTWSSRYNRERQFGDRETSPVTLDINGVWWGRPSTDNPPCGVTKGHSLCEDRLFGISGVKDILSIKAWFNGQELLFDDEGNTRFDYGGVLNLKATPPRPNNDTVSVTFTVKSWSDQKRAHALTFKCVYIPH